MCILGKHTGNGAQGHVGQREKVQVVLGRAWKTGSGEQWAGREDAGLGQGLGQGLMELPRHVED